MQVLAKGLVIGQHAYLKSGWNVMDGFWSGSPWWTSSSLSPPTAVLGYLEFYVSLGSYEHYDLLGSLCIL